MQNGGGGNATLASNFTVSASGEKTRGLLSVVAHVDISYLLIGQVRYSELKISLMQMQIPTTSSRF